MRVSSVPAYRPPEEKLSEAALFCLLLLAPLPFGSVQPWAWALLLFLAGISLALLSTADWRQGLHIFQFFPYPRLLAVLGSLTLLQLIPMPTFILERIAPATARVYELAQSTAIRTTDWHSLALDRGRAFESFSKGVLYLIAFLLALRLSRRLQTARRVLLLLVGAGSFNSAFGIYDRFTESGYVLWWQRPAFTPRLSGTYVNPDHFAGLLAMALPAAVSLAVMGSQQAAVPASWRARYINLLTNPTVPFRTLATFLAVLIAVGLIGSLSRGGCLAASSGLVIVFAGLYRIRSVQWWSIILCILLFACIAWAGPVAGRKLLSRYQAFSTEVDQSRPGRLRFIRSGVQIIGDFPLFGTGGGGFHCIFPRYDPEVGRRLRVDHVHCDVLESCVEFGIPAAVLLIWGISAVALGAWRRVPSLPESPEVLLGALGGACSLAVHSLFDFNLRIPANAVWFFVLLGVARGVSTADNPPSPPNPRQLRWVLSICLPVLVVVFACAFLLARADWISHPQVARARGDDRPPLVRIASLEHALSLWTYSAAHWAELARLRYQTALQDEVSAAHETAARLLSNASGDDQLDALEGALLTARLRNSNKLRLAREQSIRETQQAIMCCPAFLAYHEQLRFFLDDAER